MCVCVCVCVCVFCVSQCFTLSLSLSLSLSVDMLVRVRVCVRVCPHVCVLTEARDLADEKHEVNPGEKDADCAELPLPVLRATRMLVSVDTCVSA